MNNGRRCYDMQHGHAPTCHKCTNCFYFARTVTGKRICYAHYPQIINLTSTKGCEDWEPI